MATSVLPIVLIAHQSDEGQASKQQAIALVAVSGDNAGIAVFGWDESTTYTDTLAV